MKTKQTKERSAIIYSESKKAGVPNANGDIFTAEALRRVAQSQPQHLEFDEKKGVLLAKTTGTIDEWSWQSQRIWHKPWTWFRNPIKVITKTTIVSMSFSPEETIKLQARIHHARIHHELG